jgi:hypothetical protein
MMIDNTSIDFTGFFVRDDCLEENFMMLGEIRRERVNNAETESGIGRGTPGRLSQYR